MVETVIPLLFKANATDFVEGNSIGKFDQAISCEVTEEINGAFELHMEIIQNDPNLSNIEIGSIILARPNQTSGNQAFVIEQIVKSIDGTIEIYATHIAQYRAKLIPVKPFTATSLADTLSKIPTYSAETNPFTFTTDKTVSTSFKLSEPRSLRDLMGGVEGSILDIYKGEYFYSNFDIYLYNRRGRDVNIKVLYGSNMTEYVQTDEFNWSQSITGILPYYKKLENDTETVVVGDVQYSDYVDYYSYKKTIPYDFSMDFGETVPTKAQLNARAVSFLSGKGLPTVSINVSFEDLSTLPMFRSLYDNVENLQLGDTVNVINSQYNTNFNSRIRRLKYDVLMDRYETIQIGDEVASINDAISGVLATENTNEFISYTAGAGIDITNNVISADLKTVNNTSLLGSGNVAVQPVLTAGTGISISNNTISNVFSSLASPDLDDISYNYQGYGYGCTNIPTGANTSGQICVIARSQGNYCTQLYFPYNTKRVYIRKMNNGTWGTWEEIYGESSLTGGDGISISDGVITNTFDILSSGDLDDVTYNYQGYAANATTNKPTSTGGGFASFFGTGNLHGFQLFNVYSQDYLYFRRNNGTTWGTWTRVSTHYKAGNTVTFSTWYEAHGLCGSTATTLYFTLPLANPVDASSVAFTNLTISVYSNGTRTLYNTNVVGGSYTVSATIDKNINALAVTVTGLPTMTKNAPVDVEIRSGTSFTFS